MSTHKWAEVIKAWADGKEIQFFNIECEREWVDFDGKNENALRHLMLASGHLQWRIKPERWYRVVLWSNGRVGAVDKNLKEGEESWAESWAESHENFIRWLTDRIYY